uniref:Collagen triple helix repeat protein n=1 Tax=Pithovirus LCPAC404 TaxID=2506597 RepID=A0A481ZBJ6_9VIRU|nr:MAG: collagen triple helix repeat protein [Pithovirus LCPAC404]
MRRSHKRRDDCSSESGSSCPSSDKCDEGPTGPKGPPGRKGCRGEKGNNGCQGPPGRSGCRGPTGPTGPKGCRGSRGSRGSEGPAGPQGDRGPEGPQGPPGNDSGLFPFAAAYETIIVNIGDAWGKANNAGEALGDVSFKVVQVLHRGMNNSGTITPMFQNIRINSKTPDSLMEFNVIFFAPFDQMISAFVGYNAGEGPNAEDIQGITQTVSIDNQNSKGTFHLQNCGRGLGTLYIAYNVATVLTQLI